MDKRGGARRDRGNGGQARTHFGGQKCGDSREVVEWDVGGQGVRTAM